MSSNTASVTSSASDASSLIDQASAYIHEQLANAGSSCFGLFSIISTMIDEISEMQNVLSSTADMVSSDLGPEYNKLSDDEVSQLKTIQTKIDNVHSDQSDAQTLLTQYTNDYNTAKADWEGKKTKVDTLLQSLNQNVSNGTTGIKNLLQMMQQCSQFWSFIGNLAK